VAHAKALAAALHDLDGVEVVPAQPQTTMFHLLVRSTADALTAAAVRLAQDEAIWTWPRSAATDSPSWRRLELTVGDGALDFSPDELRDIVARLLADRPAAPAVAS
jgi:hypothetical protein